MTLKHLIDTNEWISVALVFEKLFPDFLDSLEEHEQVFLSLKTMEAIPSDLLIKLTDYGAFVDISGVKNGEELSYAIELRPWEEWLGMQILSECFSEFTELEIIAHCLFEMSYFGFNEDEIQDQLRQIEHLKAEYEEQQSADSQEDTDFLNEYLRNIDLENDNTDKD